MSYYESYRRSIITKTIYELISKERLLKVNSPVFIQEFIHANLVEDIFEDDEAFEAFLDVLDYLFKFKAVETNEREKFETISDIHIYMIKAFNYSDEPFKLSNKLYLRIIKVLIAWLLEMGIDEVDEDFYIDDLFAEDDYGATELITSLNKIFDIEISKYHTLGVVNTVWSLALAIQREIDIKKDNNWI